MEEIKSQVAYQEIDPVTNNKFVKDHDFDGIRELDNNPPSWLNILFVITVLFSYGYMVNFHWFKASDLQEAEYTNEMVKFTSSQNSNTGPVGENQVAQVFPLTDPARLADGKKIYTNNCAVCHLAQGQGLVGPNLTDEFWIHGGSYNEIKNIIVTGVPAKGMIAWKGQLSDKQIDNVTSYILTLQGTKPPNPKAAEGKKYIKK